MSVIACLDDLSFNELALNPRRAFTRDDDVGWAAVERLLRDHGGDGRNTGRGEALYRHAVRRASVAERRELVRGLIARIEPGTEQAYSLVAVVDAETNLGIVASAALALSLRLPPLDGDPMTGPKFLRLRSETTASATRRVALLAALLLLGDRRVLPIADGAWRLLRGRGRSKLAELVTAYPSAAAVEFFVNWLEATPASPLHPAAIALHRIARTHYAIRDVERALPMRPRGPGAVLRQTVWTVPEFGRLLTPRLVALARRGAARSDPLLARVLRDWEVAEPASGRDDLSARRHRTADRVDTRPRRG